MTTLPSNRYRQRDPGVPQDTVVLGHNRQPDRQHGWQRLKSVKYPTTCIKCGTIIVKDAGALWHSKTKKLKHLACAKT